MRERHEREQYFFDESTVDHLARFLSRWPSPCCVGAPMVARRLAEGGHDVTLLDVDDRFADIVPGFHRYDLTRPTWIDRRFDVLLCDPPFFGVSLKQLAAAIQLLSHHDFTQPIVVGYLTRRAEALRSAFARFQLVAAGYRPGYLTVTNEGKNEMELYANLAADAVAALTSHA